VALTSNAEFESIPRLSPDASKVAFSVNDQGDRVLYTVDSDGHGAPQPICDRCGAPIAWTRDGAIIYQNTHPTSSFYLFRDGESQPLFRSTPHPL